MTEEKEILLVADTEEKPVEEKPAEDVSAISPAKPKTPRKSKAKSADEIVWFESREPEPTQFAVAGYNPIRNFANGRLEFRVKASDVERFEQNHFCMNARIVRKRS